MFPNAIHYLSLSSVANLKRASLLFSLHILLISIVLCMIACAFLGLYRHLYVENLGVLSIWTILDISTSRREEQCCVSPLENRQSGGGQGNGVDVLSVRGSVQGRF